MMRRQSGHQRISSGVSASPFKVLLENLCSFKGWHNLLYMPVGRSTLKCTKRPFGLTHGVSVLLLESPTASGSSTVAGSRSELLEVVDLVERDEDLLEVDELSLLSSGTASCTGSGRGILGFCCLSATQILIPFFAALGKERIRCSLSFRLHSLRQLQIGALHMCSFH